MLPDPAPLPAVVHENPLPFNPEQAIAMTTEPYLLTPGPLTISLRTKQSMLRDWGSWDVDFNNITARVRARLLEIVQGTGTHECVPLQGSGTFGVEAAIGTLVPRSGGHVLVPQNGAYCQRITRMTRILGRKVTTIDYAEDQPVAAADIERALEADPSITHVALVHCETSTGILNPARGNCRGRRQPRPRPDHRCHELLRCAGDRCAHHRVRCGDRSLREVPRGTARHELHHRCAARRSSAARATATRWRSICMTSGSTCKRPRSGATRRPRMSWRRWTARSSSILRKAVSRRRGARYAHNCRTLLEGMQRLGLRSFLPAAIQAPIIVTFYAPDHPRYQFKSFYDAVKARGYILYPGKLTTVETFRVGCMGQLGEKGMGGVLDAVAAVLAQLRAGA